jgi:hypothetical protein
VFGPQPFWDLPVAQTSNFGFRRFPKLYSHISDYPTSFRARIELKTHPTSVAASVIHAPSDLGEKAGAFRSLNSQQLRSPEITPEEQTAPTCGNILCEDLVCENRSMLVPSGDNQRNPQGYSSCAPATANAMAVGFCQVHSILPPVVFVDIARPGIVRRNTSLARGRPTGTKDYPKIDIRFPTGTG